MFAYSCLMLLIMHRNIWNLPRNLVKCWNKCIRHIDHDQGHGKNLCVNFYFVREMTKSDNRKALTGNGNIWAGPLKGCFEALIHINLVSKLTQNPPEVLANVAMASTRLERWKYHSRKRWPEVDHAKPLLLCLRVKLFCNFQAMKFTWQLKNIKFFV